jgi:hypothetical protein
MIRKTFSIKGNQLLDFRHPFGKQNDLNVLGYLILRGKWSRIPAKQS